ncbi:MAG: glycosyltransferase family 39 protein [Selenomonadaceae bacterium]|nr:glycosyltransferase family 39 protein [Selenomonadaceae bacterium]
MESKRSFWLTLLLLTVLLLLGNNQLMVTDPVESNYTLTAQEMLAANDWLSPRIHGNYWFDKPVFFYWELMTAFSIFGMNDFAARFFPAVFAIANILLTYWLAKRIYGEKIGLMAMMIFGTALECWCLGKSIVTDMTLAFFFNASLAAFYIGFKEERRYLYLLCYAFAGLAVLTKGPIGLLLPGLIVVVFLLSRRHASELLRMKWLPGLAIFAVVAGSWYWLMYQAHGKTFIDGFLGVHNYLRATVSEHPEDNVFYYYTAIFLLGFCPWSFVLLFRLKKDWKLLRAEKMADHTVFLLQWALIVNVFFQMMATKYVTYSFPAFMPLAILTARVLENHSSFVRKLAVGTGVIMAVLTIMVAVPFSERRSCRKAAEFVKEMNTNLPVYSFGAYKASEPYYYERPIPYLVTEATKNAMKPGGLSWNAKNVMSFQTVEELTRGAEMIVICGPNHQSRLKSMLPNANIEAVAQAGRRCIMKVCLPQ